MENDGVHFLATKTVPPTRPRGVLPRPRLTGLASELWNYLLTVVKAPPGYGKTTLALAWSSQLAALGALVGWLSLDPSDCDIARFAFYMTTALDRAGIDVLKIRQAMLAPLCVVNPDSLVALLLNGIAEQPKDVFLFLDDIHCLVDSSLADAASGEPSVVAMIALLCRRAPPNLHLVMLGRTDLPNSLLSQVSPENLLEVDATALGFDLAETTQLAHKLRGEPLAPDEIHALHTTTQGWPAAIRAVLLSLNHGMKPQLCGKAFAPNRPISALMEDVLDHLPLGLTDFMIRLAVVDKVCVDLAGALTDAPDARSMLEQIGHRQLFFSARDAEQRWFSFHPLFRDQLLRRLSDTRAAEVGALHRRAAEWFAANDLWSQAVCHALLAGDDARAIEWIEQCAMRLVQTGDLLTLLSWQSQLRSHFLEMPPRLKLAFAWALGHAMASAEATRLLDQIEAGLTGDDLQADDMRWECLALRALLRNVDDDGDAAYLLARQYLARDPRDAWIRNVMLNIVASTHLRTGHWQAFHSVAPLVVADEERTRPGCFVFNRCYHLCYRGIAEYHQGRLEDAGSLFEQAVQIGDTQPEQFGIVAAPERAVWVLPASLLAQVRYQQNRLAEAATLIGECLESACVVAPLDFVAAAFQTAVRLAHCEGDGGRVSVLLDEADRLARARGWTRLESLNLLERVRICLMSRRLAEAEGCLARLDTLTALSRDADVRKAYVARDAFLAHAWVDLAHGVVARNLVELRRRFHVSLAAKLPLEAARFGMTLALAQLQAADQAGATEALTLACEQAAQAGAMRVLFDLPLPADAVVRLLQTHRDTLPANSAVAQFLAGVLPAQAPAVVDLATGREAIEVLSGRERHVLKLVAQGQSNKEIARELGVAPDTIKYHLKSVFSKLGVGNRAQAAVQAKSFGLA